MNIRLVSILGLAVASTAAFAVDPSSFANVYTLSGVSVTKGVGNAFTVSIAPGATFTGDGLTNASVKDIFGVFAFATGTGYFTNQPGTMATPPSDWGFVNSEQNVAHVGKFEDLVGYENNSKSNSIKTTKPLSFSFTTTNLGALAVTSTLNYGVHVRLTNDKTYFVSTGVPQAVPEPASMAALGLGALGLLKRRKKA